MTKEVGRRLFELRRSNASGKHQDKRERRLRTKRAKKLQAIRESKES